MLSPKICCHLFSTKSINKTAILLGDKILLRFLQRQSRDIRWCHISSGRGYICRLCNCVAFFFVLFAFVLFVLFLIHFSTYFSSFILFIVIVLHVYRCSFLIFFFLHNFDSRFSHLFRWFGFLFALPFADIVLFEHILIKTIECKTQFLFV